YRRFKFEIAKIVERDGLPGYALSLEQYDGKREPSLRMRRREDAGQGAIPAPAPKGKGKATAAPPQTPSAPDDLDSMPLPKVSALIRRSITSLATRATAGEITDATLATLRAECPGWDYQTLHQEFRGW